MLTSRRITGNHPPDFALQVGLIVVLLLSLVSVPQAGASDTGFEIRYAGTHIDDGMLVLDAQISYQLSPAATEALQNGVALFIIIDVELIRPRKWYLDKTVAEFEHHFKIERHALSGQYLFTNLATGERRRFESMEEMLARLGAITGLRVVDSAQLNSAPAYNGRIRARLDIEALPTPLRPMAYLSKKWRLTSPWYHWQVKP